MGDRPGRLRDYSGQIISAPSWPNAPPQSGAFHFLGSLRVSIPSPSGLLQNPYRLSSGPHWNKRKGAWKRLRKMGLFVLLYLVNCSYLLCNLLRKRNNLNFIAVRVVARARAISSNSVFSATASSIARSSGDKPRMSLSNNSFRAAIVSGQGSGEAIVGGSGKCCLARRSSRKY